METGIINLHGRSCNAIDDMKNKMTVASVVSDKLTFYSHPRAVTLSIDDTLKMLNIITAPLGKKFVVTDLDSE